MSKKELFKTIHNEKSPVYYQYVDRGAKETVVFIPGLFSTSSIFRHFLKLITCNIILMELRGVVWSEINKPYVNNYVEDLRLILEKENINNKITLVGYSLGCSIANEFAEKYSEKVDKAILLAPVNRDLKEIGTKGIVKRLIKGLGNDFFKKWKNYLKLQRVSSPFKLFRLFNLKLLEITFEKIQLTNKCKIIILNGSMDTFFDPKDTNLKLPNIIHERIENLDHFLFLKKKRIKIIAHYLNMHLQPSHG